MNNSTATPSKSRITRKARLLGLLAVAVSAVALVPAGASASTVKADSSVDLFVHSSKSGFWDMTATVSSSQKACQKNRPITILRDSGGLDGPTLYDSGIASPTFSTGVRLDDESLFTAVVERTKVKKGGKKIVCRATETTETID